MVEVPPAGSRRHGLRRPEVDHVERAHRPDVRNLRAGNGAEAILAGAHHAAADEVGDLGRRRIDHPGDEAAVDQLFHRPAARAGGVKDEAVVVVFQHRHGLRYAWRRHAEHGEADRRLAIGFGRDLPRHAGDGVGRIGENRAADPVQPGDVGDRIHHGDVADADEGADIAGGERRYHQLRQADGERAHAGGDDRGSAAATDADHAGDVLARRDEAGEGLAHGRDCRAAVVGIKDRNALGVESGDLAAGHVHGHRRGARPDIDDERFSARGGDHGAEISQFLALGVRCPDDVDALHLAPLPCWRPRATPVTRP